MGPRGGLPLRPCAAEWIAVGEGKQSLSYRPFTEIEHNVPWIFAALFVAIGFRTLANHVVVPRDEDTERLTAKG